MKRLYIVRHAKSSWDDMHQLDFDRPLNERGLRDAPKMGKRLREYGVHPDLMISSPAVRAITTCKIIALAIGYPEDQIKTDRRIYHAAEEQLLSVVKGWHSLNAEVVVMVGHNPGLTAFANRLLNDSIDNIPTCGIISGELTIDSWEEAEWGRGTVRFFEIPK